MTSEADVLRAEDIAQRAMLRALPICDVLITAPPGCGKTEALADRALGLMEQGAVERPQRMLALTFSNRARENLRERLVAKLGAAHTMVFVANLHGFSSRLIRAHGVMIGVDSSWQWPQRGWRAQAWRDIVGRQLGRMDVAEGILREIKSRPMDDDEVMDALLDIDNADAIAFETGRREARRLDYQDLLRHAQRLLGIESCCSTYRLHFGVVLLDEAQDLTRQQLDIASAVGRGRMTSAADVEQGIYGFRGADAGQVIEQLQESDPVPVVFHRSFRSTDAILRCVNALSDSGQILVAANPQDWPDQGVVTVLRSATKEEEATLILELCGRLLNSNPDLRIGVISRTRYRPDVLVTALATSGLPHSVWDSPTDNAALGRLLRGCFRDVRDTSADQREVLAALVARARSEIDPADSEMLDELAEVIISLEDLLDTISLEEAVKRCRSAEIDGSIPKGVNVLTGHEGKGQQFDWVVIIGLEDGTIPHYRASDPELPEEKRLLRVMAFRARYGLVLAAVGGWRTQYGTWKAQQESRWLPLLEGEATATWADVLGPN